MIVSQCTYDGGVFCLHVFSIWNAAFANTHTLRFGRDAADISGYACDTARNTSAHSCSAVWPFHSEGHVSTVGLSLDKYSLTAVITKLYDVVKILLSVNKHKEVLPPVTS